ncbi:hypothetical protein ASS64_03815 [Erythrobacter sp. AP23]|nr:hypothetical protein ASS64_03815 [Erythrobacter sp. AP23]
MEDYDGFSERVSRLGLAPLVTEAETALSQFELLLRETKHANGTKDLRIAIDDGFEAAGDWTKLTVGGIDWRKSNRNGGAIGVEVQVSGRSDLLAVDVLHLKTEISSGHIDAGIIIVPDDKTSKFLTDRTPNFRTAKKHVELHASDLPIRIIAFEHDGIGPPLKKMRTNLGKL